MRSWLLQTGFMLTTLAAVAALLSTPAAAADPCSRVVFSANPDCPPYHWAEGDRIVGASVALTGRWRGASSTSWAWSGKRATSAPGHGC